MGTLKNLDYLNELDTSSLDNSKSYQAIHQAHMPGKGKRCCSGRNDLYLSVCRVGWGPRFVCPSRDIDCGLRTSSDDACTVTFFSVGDLCNEKKRSASTFTIFHARFLMQRT